MVKILLREVVNALSEVLKSPDKSQTSTKHIGYISEISRTPLKVLCIQLRHTCWSPRPTHSSPLDITNNMLEKGWWGSKDNSDIWP